jgi:hypothetical protein
MFNNNEEFQEWGKLVGFSEQTILLIKNIRESEPARRVRSGPFNVGGRFNRSYKMAHTIQHESRTVEFPALLLMELDALYDKDDVLEIWDQPPSFVVNYQGENGRNLGHYYTADFFVIRRKSAGWEEWKLEENLQKVFNKNPEKYYKDDQGKWHFPPGERYASSFGLYFHVHSSSEINWILFRNLKLLLPYYNPLSETTSSIHRAVLSSVENTPGITLIELFEQVKEAKNTHIFELLLTKEIFIDLREVWLGDSHLVQLFISKEVGEFFSQLNKEQLPDFNKSCPRVIDLLPGTTVRWNDVILEIMLISETEIMLRRDNNDHPIFSHQAFEQFVRDGRITDFQLRPMVDKDSEAFRLIQRFGSSQALVEALHRLNIIKPALEGKKITDKSYTEKTYRNWIND